MGITFYVDILEIPGFLTHNLRFEPAISGLTKMWFFLGFCSFKKKKPINEPFFIF